MKTALQLLAIVGFGYLGLAVLIAFKQRDYLYYPTANYQHPLQTETLENDGEQIEFIVFNNQHRDAIIYFGGIGESVAHSSPPMASSISGHAAYFVSYRGYGGSTGTPTEAGLYSDALAIYDLLKHRHRRISVIGRSLGTGVATYVASNRAIENLILVTPFDSIERIAKDLFPIFPVSLLLKDKYRSADRAPTIRSRTLVIMAENDNVIPRKYTEGLIRVFPRGAVETRMIPGTGHNNLSNSNLYYSIIREFLDLPG